MTRPADDRREARIVSGLATVVLVAASLRLLAAVVAGIVELAQRSPFPDEFPTSALRTADVFLTFGNAGDGAGALLALVAAGLLWWRTRLGDPPGGSLRTIAGWVLALTALSALAQGVGYSIVSTRASVDSPRLIVSLAFSLAWAFVAAAGWVAMRRFDLLVDERLVAGDDVAVDALVFAVDRDTRDVQAFFSVDEAARRMHVYSVEEDEFEFFTDDGVVVEASVQGESVVLRLTDVSRRDELLGHLREFVLRRGIHIDMSDADHPSAYAVPISDWQWLQLWPAWTRWLGHIIRRS